MSWEVHVTRGTYRMDEDAPPITVEEWLAYARSQPDLKVLPAPAGQPPEVIFDEGGERGEVCITWQDGRLSAWNPYERSIGRMVRIAREIGGGAHCEDDDGRRGYDEQGNFDPSMADPPRGGIPSVAGQASAGAWTASPAASTPALVALLVKKRRARRPGEVQQGGEGGQREASPPSDAKLVGSGNAIKTRAPAVRARPPCGCRMARGQAPVRPSSSPVRPPRMPP